MVAGKVRWTGIACESLMFVSLLWCVTVDCRHNHRTRSHAASRLEQGEEESFFIGHDLKLILDRNRTVKQLQDCADVNQMSTHDNPYGACSTVVNKCNPSSGIVNYLALPYCAMPDRKWVAFGLLLIWVVILCIWIFSIIDFLCPNLIAMTDVCEMRESVAGVTFLAFGHSCPEVFDMVTSSLHDINGMSLAIGLVLGQGMFVFCFVQGMIAVMFPFVVNGSEYLRDSGFYAIGILMALIFLADANLTILESILMLAVYLIYMAIVIYFDHVLKIFGLPPLEDDESKAIKINEKKALLSTERYGGYSYSFESNRGSLTVEIADYVNPIEIERFVEGSIGEKIYQILQAPAIFLLRITVPTVDKKRANGGWCRPATCIQVALLPLFLVMFMYTHTLPEALSDVYVIAWIFWGAVLLGLALGSLVYFTSQSACAPEYHMLLAFVGFANCLVWVFATAQEIVNIMITLGQVAQVDRAIIGMTLLAVGVASGELICNIGLASAGHAGIAVAACVGAPVFVIYLGMGIAGIAANLLVSSPYPMQPTNEFIGGVAFLLIAVFSACIWLIALGRQEGSNFDLAGGRSFGVFLLVLYAAFFGYTVYLEFADK